MELAHIYYYKDFIINVTFERNDRGKYVAKIEITDTSVMQPYNNDADPLDLGAKDSAKQELLDAIQKPISLDSIRKIGDHYDKLSIKIDGYGDPMELNPSAISTLEHCKKQLSTISKILLGRINCYCTLFFIPHRHRERIIRALFTIQILEPICLIPNRN